MSSVDGVAEKLWEHADCSFRRSFTGTHIGQKHIHDGAVTTLSLRQILGS